jgi:hypothetical protein
VIDAKLRGLCAALAAACALALAGCATQPVSAPQTYAPPSGRAVLSALRLDPALENRILALDPDHITPQDVRDTLAKGPTPQILMIHGGIYPVHLVMESFGGFLTGMGYPEDRIRDPGDQRWSHSPYEDSTHLAGLIAWFYERDGMPPIVIGHSQGGIQAVKVLRELDGQYGDDLHVWNPITDSQEARTTIVDPMTGKERPVRGLTVDYVSVAAVGGAALLLPNQWSMIGHVDSVPNTVEDFTGYSISLDLWAWHIGDADGAFTHNGTAHVRNVSLPAWYNHVLFPITEDLATNPVARPWIDRYVPDRYTKPVPLEDSGRSVLWAADVWYGVKKHWCIEAQRLILARRAAFGISGGTR